MTSRSGGEHDSFFGLPLSGDLLASKVAQIDDAIQYEPLVGSSAWKSEIRISAKRENRMRIDNDILIDGGLWIVIGRTSS